MRKNREKELRDQTNERLKNYHVMEKPIEPHEQKPKYENYLKQIKVNKSSEE